MIQGASSDPHAPTPTTPRQSGKIKKTLEHKLAQIFSHQRTVQSDLCIYVDSEEEEANHLPPSSSEGERPLPLQAPTDEFLRESSLSSSSEQWSLNEQSCPKSLIGKNPLLHHCLNPIFRAQAFMAVSQIDFQLYSTFLVRTKIYGSVLVDEWGRVLWCDKAAHELLEGSLNNFERMRVQDFLLHSELPRFLQEMAAISHYDKRTILQWIVYSKNSKRRFFKVPLPKHPNAYDIFYRFLKFLTVRVRPIAVTLPGYRDPQGFCNEKILATRGPVNCFYLELRNAKRPPNLKDIHIQDDPVIKKFLMTSKNKANHYLHLNIPERQQARNQKMKEKNPSRGRSGEYDEEEGEGADGRKGARSSRRTGGGQAMGGGHLG